MEKINTIIEQLDGEARGLQQQVREMKRQLVETRTENAKLREENTTLGEENERLKETVTGNRREFEEELEVWKGLARKTSLAWREFQDKLKGELEQVATRIRATLMETLPLETFLLGLSHDELVKLNEMEEQRKGTGKAKERPDDATSDGPSRIPGVHSPKEGRSDWLNQLDDLEMDKGTEEGPNNDPGANPDADQGVNPDDVGGLDGNPDYGNNPDDKSDQKGDLDASNSGPDPMDVESDDDRPPKTSSDPRKEKDTTDQPTGSGEPDDGGEKADDDNPDGDNPDDSSGKPDDGSRPGDSGNPDGGPGSTSGGGEDEQPPRPSTNPTQEGRKRGREGTSEPGRASSRRRTGDSQNCILCELPNDRAVARERVFEGCGHRGCYTHNVALRLIGRANDLHAQTGNPVTPEEVVGTIPPPDTVPGPEDDWPSCPVCGVQRGAKMGRVRDFGRDASAEYHRVRGTEPGRGCRAKLQRQYLKEMARQADQAGAQPDDQAGAQPDDQGGPGPGGEDDEEDDNMNMI